MKCFNFSPQKGRRDASSAVACKPSGLKGEGGPRVDFGSVPQAAQFQF